MIKRINAAENFNNLSQLRSYIFKQIQEQLQKDELEVGNDVYSIKNLSFSRGVTDGKLSFTFMDIDATISSEIFPINNTAYFKTNLYSSSQDLIPVSNLTFKFVENDEIKEEYDFYFVGNNGVTEEEQKNKAIWANTYLGKLIKHLVLLEQNEIDNFENI